MTTTEARILELPRFADSRGNLSFVESGRHIPFEVKRIFYLTEVPVGAARAGHALRKCEQFIVAISGSFDLVVDYGVRRETFHLNRSDCGLYVPALVWREIHNFSAHSVCLVLASEFYDIQDYLDEYADFRKAVGAPEM